MALGEVAGQSSEFVQTLGEIWKREGASSPDEAQYAIIHRQFQTPHERRILGLPFGVDRGEAEYYLYKGESFRIGGEYYKVNWVSIEGREWQ